MERSGAFKAIVIGTISTVLGSLALYLLGFQSKPKPPDPPIPSFTSPIDTDAVVIAFEKFIDENRGDLVFVNTVIASDLLDVSDGEENGTLSLMFFGEHCPTPKSVLECLRYTLQISAKEFEIGNYQGSQRFSGYFVISENMEGHQGAIYSLRSVAADRVLLSAPRSRAKPSGER